MSRFALKKTPLEGLKVIVRKPVGDSRGVLERLFCQDTLGELMHGKEVRQINRTFTQKKGTIRGLHFQYPPFAETKIITCIKGKVLDVAVDLRQGSSTFLQYHALLLGENDSQSFLIPEGFAHGFQTLTPNCEMLYFHTASYNPEAEGALNACDPRLAINWPELIVERSERDRNHPLLNDNFNGIEL